MVETVKIRGKLYVDIIGVNKILRDNGYPEIEIKSGRTTEKASWCFRK